MLNEFSEEHGFTPPHLAWYLLCNCRNGSGGLGHDSSGLNTLASPKKGFGAHHTHNIGEANAHKGLGFGDNCGRIAYTLNPERVKGYHFSY